jgi:hypothetical protein
VITKISRQTRLRRFLLRSLSKRSPFSFRCSDSRVTVELATSSEHGHRLELIRRRRLLPALSLQQCLRSRPFVRTRKSLETVRELQIKPFFMHICIGEIRFRVSTRHSKLSVQLSLNLSMRSDRCRSPDLHTNPVGSARFHSIQQRRIVLIRWSSKVHLFSCSLRTLLYLGKSAICHQ